MKNLTKEEVISILDEKFPFYDNKGTSWEEVDEERELGKSVLFGSSRHHYYKVNLNGRYCYSLRNGMRGGIYFFLSREDALSGTICNKEDIINNIIY